MIVGARRDPDWGAVLMLGMGGIWVETLHDVQLLPADADEDDHRRGAQEAPRRPASDGFARQQAGRFAGHSPDCRRPGRFSVARTGGIRDRDQSLACLSGRRARARRLDRDPPGDVIVCPSSFAREKKRHASASESHTACRGRSARLARHLRRPGAGDLSEPSGPRDLRLSGRRRRRRAGALLRGPAREGHRPEIRGREQGRRQRQDRHRCADHRPARRLHLAHARHRGRGRQYVPDEGRRLRSDARPADGGDADREHLRAHRRPREQGRHRERADRHAQGRQRHDEVRHGHRRHARRLGEIPDRDRRQGHARQLQGHGRCRARAVSATRSTS